VKFGFIKAQEVAFPVQSMCQVLGVSRSGYYAWKGRPAAGTDPRTVALAVEIASAHRRSRGNYGSPRIHRELRARGIRVSRKRIERLMRERGLKGAQKCRFHCTTDSRHSLPIAPNRLERNFDPKMANRVWAGDVTYIATEQGWLYLAVIIDLFSRRVVGWSVSPNNDTKLAEEALRRALKARRPGLGLLHHTDRGSPYASLAYTAILRQYGVVASMSRAGDCYDNAVVESFFGTLKAELVRGCVYPSRVVATAAIADYLENFYNTQRRHSHLQYLSPIEFELRSQTAAFAA
jgi:transposase InsO family protein